VYARVTVVSRQEKGTEEGYQRSDISDRRQEKAYAEGTESKQLTEKRKQIPPLRDPTRHKSARQKKSGRFGRDDNLRKGTALG
jgi:hypothetical protein